ncbi:hypothetical protein A45J_1503 [hot springs metagenome]|uniref:Uncharacterized protein n=1 Tax=hot springs metagenome TaxID=433727 RepID=A0A5J4L4L7_9ZZZZ
MNEQAVKRLADCLNKYHVIFGYIFSSQVKAEVSCFFDRSLYF